MPVAGATSVCQGEGPKNSIARQTRHGIWDQKDAELNKKLAKQTRHGNWDGKLTGASFRQSPNILQQTVLSNYRQLEAASNECLKGSTCGKKVLNAGNQGLAYWKKFSDWNYAITTTKTFDNVVMFLILCNSIFLAIEDPSSEEPLWYTRLDMAFTACFTLECSMKICALGWKYFKSNWNLLDFIVVLQSLISLGLPSTYDVSWLRTLRVLRPLRTIKRMPSMRLLVMASVKSISALNQMFLIFLAFLVVCTAICCNLFAGKLRHQCYSEQFEEFADADIYCDADFYTQPRLCTDVAFLNRPDDCTIYESYTCTFTGESPNDGLSSFDNFWFGLLLLFEVTTREGWASPMESTQHAYSDAVVVIYFFVILIGGFILMNMMVAAYLIEFQRGQEIMKQEFGAHQEKANLDGDAEDKSGHDSIKINKEVAPNELEVAVPSKSTPRHIISSSGHIIFFEDESERSTPSPSVPIFFSPESSRREISSITSKSSISSHEQQDKILSEDEMPLSYAFSLLEDKRNLSIEQNLSVCGGDCGVDKNKISHRPLTPLKQNAARKERIFNEGKSMRSSFIADAAKYMGSTEGCGEEENFQLSKQVRVGQKSFDIDSKDQPGYKRRAKIPISKSSSLKESEAEETKIEEKAKNMTSVSLPEKALGIKALSSLRNAAKVHGDAGAFVSLSKKYQHSKPNVPLEHTTVRQSKEYPTLPPGSSLCRVVGHKICFGIGIDLLDQQCNDSSMLTRFITGCIFFNVLLLAMDWYNIPNSLYLFLYYSNLVLVGIFTCEAVFKLIALGVIRYLKSVSNLFDLIIVGASLVEIWMSSGSAAMSSLRVITRLFRAFRIARLGKLSSRWNAMRKAVRILIRSFYGVGPAACVGALLLFVLSVLGLQLFGTSLDGSGTSDDEIRYRFDTFKWAFISVFYLTIGDNWTDMMNLAIQKTSGWAVIYFVLTIMIGQWYLINVILAIVLNGCTESVNHRTEIEQFVHRIHLRMRRLHLKISFRKLREHAQAKNSPREHCRTGWEKSYDVKYVRHWTRQKTSPVALCLVYAIQDQSQQIHELPINFCNHFQQATGKIKLKKRIGSPKQGESFFKHQHQMFNIQKEIITACQRISKSSRVNRFMVAVVVINWLLLLEFTSAWAVELLCTIIFALEVVWKSIGYGFLHGPKAFLKSRWNIADFVLVLCGFIFLIEEKRSPTSTLYKLMSISMSFRPVRLVSRIEECRILFEAIGASLASLGTIALIILVLVFIYSLIGLQLFKGTFHSCSDENFPEGAYRYGTTNSDGEYLTAPCSGTFINATTGEEVTRDYEWEASTMNFDSIFSAMGVIFHLLALEGWQAELFQAMDSVSEDYQPKTFHSTWAFLYFMVGACIFGMYVNNLVVAVVFDSFIEKTSYTESGMRLNATQRLMNIYQMRLMRVLPLKKSRPAYKGCVFQVLHRIARSSLLDKVVAVLLFVQTVMFLLTHANQSAALTTAQTNFRIAFALIFVVEACIKILGLGLVAYFKSLENVYDFICTLASFLSVVFLFADGCAFKSNFFLELISTSRLFRALALMSYFAFLRQYKICFLYPIKDLANTVLLMLMILFIYASIGRQLFSGIDYDSSITNFDDMMSSLQLMIIALSGEFATYLEISLELSPTVPGSCVYIFFCTFYLLQSFLLVNMFVMFIVETFSLLNNGNANLRIEELIPTYQKIWCKYDEEGSGFIEPKDFPQFLLDLPEEIGIGAKDPYLYLVNVIDRIETQPGYKYGFYETLKSLCTIACYPDVLADLKTSQDLYMLFRKVWGAILIKHYLRRYVQKVKQRKLQSTNRQL